MSKEIIDENIVSEDLETSMEEEKEQAEIICDDEVNEEESLQKNVEKENIFENAKKEKKKALKKSVLKKVKIGGIAAGVVAIVAGAAIILTTFVFKAKDADKFIVDSPDDPLAYSNVASSFEDENIIPIFRFSVYGKYNGIAEDDATKTYTFNFDETGYFEGYSSIAEDDFGSWELASDGEDILLVVNCTETEDRYKVEILENGILSLVGKNNTFTLTQAVD